MTQNLLVDVHAHLDDAAFEKDIDAVLANAKEAGVSTIICNSLNIEGMERVLELSRKHALAKPALGIYPDEVLKLSGKELEKAFEFIRANSGKAIAIGEVGLDCSTDENKAGLEKQMKALAGFCQLSLELGKPLVLHTRKAEKETIELLEKQGVKKALFHCFGGSLKLVDKVIEKGWLLSIPPIVNRSQHFQEIVKRTPLNQLLAETDAPWMSPLGRGHRNEPANVKVSVEKIAQIKGMTFEETAQQLYMNYQRLFL